MSADLFLRSLPALVGLVVLGSLGALLVWRLSRRPRPGLVFESLDVGIVLLDPQNRVADLNGAAVCALDRRPEEVSGQAALTVLPRWLGLKELLELDDGSVDRSRECDDGAVSSFEVSVHPLINGRRRTVGRVISLRDVTNSRSSGGAPARDPLTGLSTRSQFEREGSKTLELARRQKWTAGLLVVDVNELRTVNDRFGYHVGDELLVELATRLSQRIRSCEAIARIGEDEFGVLLQRATPDDAARVCLRLEQSLEKPFICGGQTIDARVAVGIAMFPEDADDLQGLLERANATMYLGKAAS